MRDVVSKPNGQPVEVTDDWYAQDSEGNIWSPAGHYTDMLMTSNVNPLEPKVQEYKFYAEGVGPALVVLTSGAVGTEELVSFER